MGDSIDGCVWEGMGVVLLDLEDRECVIVEL